MTYINEIIQLRDNQIATSRGYEFEQIIRKILPWDFKPPVPLCGDSEQLDAIFTWKNQAYLVECKAKRGQIKVGSSDWEDYELKIRRHRNVIGLFCSLYPINEKIYERASDLIKEGYPIIVFDGCFWDELVKSSLSVADVLDYMNQYGRYKYIAKPPKLYDIEKWRFNKEEIMNRLSAVCHNHSHLMHMRYKTANHENTYITRGIERQILSYANGLMPNLLTREKEMPNQICLLRDCSGSGKTTTSIQISLMNTMFFGVAMTANEREIDKKCFSFFQSLGDDFGIRELRVLNMPIIVIIDSLDEASNSGGKKTEVLTILRSIIDELNTKAQHYDLLVYPVLFVFTIREDYWRDWESIFEGRHRFEIINRISRFNENEFRLALDKYMSCYGYSITNELQNEAIEVLSRPINLLIFSETNENAGQITVSEIWECSVIYNYYRRKLDNISRRNIPYYSAPVFMNLLSDIAYNIIKSKNTIIKSNIIESIIKEKYTIYNPFCEAIIRVLISEYILVNDYDSSNCYRYRHSRFLEFLMAYYCISTIRRNDNIYYLDKLLEISFESGLVHMFRIHNDMLFICSKECKELEVELDNYYSKNNVFMSRKISSLRGDLASNIVVNKEDISLILKNVNSRDPELIIESFLLLRLNRVNNQTRLSLIRLKLPLCL